MLARMVRTKSYGASTDVMFDVSILQAWPRNSTRAPSCSSTRAMVRVSDRSGTLRSVCTPGASSVAAMTGSAAFFAPLISTRPVSLRPPRMISASMVACWDASGSVWDEMGLGAPTSMCVLSSRVESEMLTMFQRNPCAVQPDYRHATGANQPCVDDSGRGGTATRPYDPSAAAAVAVPAAPDLPYHGDAAFCMTLNPGA